MNESTPVWTVEPCKDTQGNPCGLNVVNTLSGNIVCWIPDSNGGITWRGPKHKTQNAKLIESAPSLIEALERLLVAANVLNAKLANFEEYRSTIDEAEQVLKRAR